MKRSTKFVLTIATSVALFSIGSGVANASTPQSPTKGNSSWILSPLPPIPPLPPLAPLAPQLPVSYQPPTKPIAVSTSPRPCASTLTPPSVPFKLSLPAVTVPASIPTAHPSFTKPITPAVIVPAFVGSVGVAAFVEKPVTPSRTVSNAPIAAPAKAVPMGSLAHTGSDTGVLTELALTLLTTGVVLLIVTASKPRNNVLFTSPETTASTE
jgi:hypothetical protein